MKKKWTRIFICVFMVLALCQGHFCLHVSAKTGELRVAFKTDMPFYQFTDEDGQAAGMHVDIMNALARELKRDVVYIPVQTNQIAIEMLTSGEVDLVLGVPYYLEGEFNTTSEISNSETAIFAPKALWEEQENPKISSYRLVLEFGVNNQPVVNNLGAKQYVVTGSQKRVLEAHQQGKAELMLCDKACMEYLLREQGILADYVIVQGQLDNPSYTIALEKRNSALRRAIENALMTIRLSGEHEGITEKWIPEEKDGSEWLKKIILALAAILIVVGGALTAYVYILYRIRRMLEKEVAEKTSALNQKVRQLSYESELRNRIIEHSPSGMVLVDWDCKITLINKSACRMADVVKTSTGSNIYDIHFFRNILFWAGIKDRLTLLKGITEYTLSLSDKSNVERIYQLSVLPTYQEERCNGALLTIEDITAKEEQRMAAVEKEKNQVMNRLIAGIAHEIKNPLTGIRNFAELIRTKKDDPRFLEYFTTLVPEEVDRISRLVESLMQYARPPKGKQEQILLTELLKECVTLVQPMALVHEKLRVATELQNDLHIWADRDQMKQVFINLFMNGINAVERKMQKEEKIASLAMRITAEMTGEYIVIKVIDHGIGMTAEEVKKCTEPFFTTRPQGNGLGLATAKRFIQENDGMMWIDSEKGVGTCVTVRFRRYDG